jgi:bifunctional non-homologous end joining protein LigD
MGKLRIGEYTVETSSLDKVLFPGQGITKGELIDYYHHIADTMVPHMRGRPLSMRRYPNGINGTGFYQQEAPEYFPDWIERVTVEKEGGNIVHAICNDTATLVYLANQNTITPHVWLSRSDHVRKPDQIIFDLDPSGNDFAAVRTAARYVREILEEQDLGAYLMTTGSSGVHVRAPVRPEHDFDVVRGFARRLADVLAEKHPDEVTTEQRKNKRHGRVYLDVMRNAYAQTAVTPYAVRALEGAPIATPLDWDELREADPQRYTIRNIFRRMGQKKDPWADMYRSAARLRPERVRA